MKCILCARRGKVTEGTSHVCVACAAWLQVQVADIARLAADAVAFVAPGSSSGGGSRPVPGSRPPCRVDALDPELTIVDGQTMTVLECLELWERMVREMRQMAPYGPVSAARARSLADVYAGTSATLVGVVTFLGAQVAWMTTEPEFPVEDFADEVRACVRVLRRWDVTAEERGQVVPCPTVLDDGTDCGYRLHYRDMTEQVTCRRCGVTRDVPQLLMAADADNALVDAEALAGRFGIDTSTIRKWARHGKVERQGQRYRYGDVREMVATMRGQRVG